MRTRSSFLKIILPSLIFLASCFGIKSDKEVENDTLEFLKAKYNENFTVVSVTNNTQGHGRGALWATGNDFTVELNSEGEDITWFQARVAYDSNKKFVFYGDTYKEEVLGDQMKNDFTKILKEGYPKQMACNIFFQVSNDSALSQLDVKKINYKVVLPMCPYSISLSSGSVYFFKKYPETEKEVTEYLRKYFIQLQKYKLMDLDLFVYYWDEKYIKDQPVDSLNIVFGYESQGTSFEFNKAPERSYRFKFTKEELDHMDTLNLYRYMKDF